MKGPSGQSLEFIEAVENESVFVLGFRRHVTQLLDVSISDSKGENAHSKLGLQDVGRGPRVAPVAIPVSNQKHSL